MEKVGKIFLQLERTVIWKEFGVFGKIICIKKYIKVVGKINRSWNDPPGCTRGVKLGYRITCSAFGLRVRV